MFNNAKKTVLDTIRETKAEITHVQEVGGAITDELRALSEIEGSTFKFNSAAIPGKAKIHIGIEAPDHDKYAGAFMLVDNTDITFYLDTYPCPSGREEFTSDAAGVDAVLKKVTRQAVVNKQIP